jgi:hypothetical protein
MDDESFTPPVAVEAIHEKQVKKRRWLISAVVFAVFLLLFAVFFRGGKPPDARPLTGVIAYNTTTLTVPPIEGPLAAPEGFRLLKVSDREAPFQMGMGFIQVSGKEMVFEKDGLKYNVYVGSGTPEGWRRLVGGPLTTVEENISDKVYSAPYKYFDEKIVFLFWWHNDKIIGVNATDRTEEVMDLTEKLVDAYPPTDSLLSAHKTR